MPGIPVAADAFQLVEKIDPDQKVFLFLDYDGTLVPIAPTPAEAVPPPSLINLLNILVRLPNMKVAVISGRPVKDLASLMPVKGLVLAGLHGLELPLQDARADQSSFLRVVPAINMLSGTARALIEGKNGFLLEEKGFSLALHYRLADPSEAAEVTSLFREKCDPLLSHYGLEILQGKMVFEVRPGEANKGRAVKSLLGLWPEALPVYVGDDLTDEDAFRFLDGTGLCVLVSPEERESSARFRFTSQDEVGLFLNLLAKQFLKEAAVAETP
jgi:trehalose 6-phosphate phosphatase